MDLSLLLLVFRLIFTVVSRLLLLYSTIDKTSRLKMKSFSTVRDTQRGSQLHGEEKREEGVRGDPNNSLPATGMVSLFVLAPQVAIKKTKTKM